MEKEPMMEVPGDAVKMEVDYSETCDVKLPEIEKLGKSQPDKLNEAVEQLLVLEKQTRTGGDMISTGRVLVLVVQLCHHHKNWKALNENISVLAKRRGQLKQAVVKMVQEVCTYLDNLPTKDLKYELIGTLRNVTEGKIYVEVERARLTHKLSKMREEEGNIKEAATILQELQVETYGSMEKREKVELILEQMRYCLAIDDYIRTQIISKKINVKYFEKEDTHDLKIKYYELMFEVDQHDEAFLSICRHFRAMLNTPMIQQDETKRLNCMKSAALYLVLSPFDHDQSDLMFRVLEEKPMADIPQFKSLLELFTNQELINWQQLCDNYERLLKSGDGATGVFDESDQGKKRWKCLKDRVVEHNIRIMAKYYTRVSLQRMSRLLHLEPSEVEEVLCKMIVAKQISGKADRPNGVVSFQSTKDPSELLNDWSHNLNTLMTLIARTTHLINKEEMVHRHLLSTGPVKNAPVPAVDSTLSMDVDGSSPMEVEN